MLTIHSELRQSVVDLGSADYQAAVRETKALFIDGLCCGSNANCISEQVLSEPLPQSSVSWRLY